MPFTRIPLRPRATAQDESKGWSLKVRYDLSGDDLSTGQGVVDINFPGGSYVRKMHPRTAQTPEASLGLLEFADH